ncbi:hypothetical protein B9Z19DRAFT_437119 [Tuber borchii]|uniref:Uncharacterized protein n=1 Tax=Tuber borchii TaxID=42251 RepID=A0A2T6ZG96_TUBBO|nr:hypothetical protein B9Z19DRAFT_437119 [Tuber borchii]
MHSRGSLKNGKHNRCIHGGLYEIGRNSVPTYANLRSTWARRARTPAPISKAWQALKLHRLLNNAVLQVTKRNILYLFYLIEPYLPCLPFPCFPFHFPLPSPPGPSPPGWTRYCRAQYSSTIPPYHTKRSQSKIGGKYFQSKKSMPSTIPLSTILLETQLSA